MSDTKFHPVFIGPGGSPAPILAADVGSTPAESLASPRCGCRAPPFAPSDEPFRAGVVAGDDTAMKAMRKGLVAGIPPQQAMDRRLGDARAPLFVSVRSGAEKSMPGMMDTILGTLEMNAVSVHGLIRVTGNPRMAFDSWCLVHPGLRWRKRSETCARRFPPRSWPRWSPRGRRQ